MENVTRQFQWCFPPFSHPAKGVSTAEYSTLLCFGILAVLMVMSTTGQQLGDFYHQVNGRL
jgi:Flp pilus assembly pilin Flp